MRCVLFVEKIWDKTNLATSPDTKTTPTTILYKQLCFSTIHSSFQNVGSSVVSHQNLLFHCCPISLLLSEGEENWSCRNGTCGNRCNQQPGQAGIQRGQHHGYQAGTLQELPKKIIFKLKYLLNNY